MSPEDSLVGSVHDMKESVSVFDEEWESSQSKLEMELVRSSGRALGVRCSEANFFSGCYLDMLVRMKSTTLKEKM